MFETFVFAIGLIGLIGLFVGSFLNVCIYRLPQAKSVIRPPSRCPVCGQNIKVLDLVPVLSWLLLRGRCRYCNTSISRRYIFIELLTASLFLFISLVIGPQLQLIMVLLFASYLIVISVIDYDHHLILNKVLLWFAATGIFVNNVFGNLGFNDSVAAVLTGGGLMLLIAAVTHGDMGGGDVKFIAALGVWLDSSLILLTLFLSFLLGGSAGGLLMIFRIKSRKDFIPFGPFIAIGALVSMLYGHSIIRWYLELRF
ncbi:MAG TPA: prepilin peptidase [Methylomusa anaerophila]|uniref:Type 4 prepilin-like proteins leader peptide-processing enzyme n=1 Tax=Methylomusa anaerophila TaxID=1930071 RepID=A0A348AQH3_9FIRM|nr:A24 family peptidase [Methylomusa anaerophila]BBB93321.1 type 4 prepilin-like proteins leader peptide-processing enzyme [Methylomusa anaerophila]HML86848.1 prepilin peptidase [Methylomusa anaerophila]